MNGIVNVKVKELLRVFVAQKGNVLCKGDGSILLGIILYLAK